MGISQPIGIALKDSINLGVESSVSDHTHVIFQSLIGDPTLRMQVLTPAAILSGSINGSDVTLTWTPSPESEVHYYVYRAEDGMDDDFVLLNANSPANSNSFTTTTASMNEVYQVRAAKLITTGSGSFTNLSQAVFWP